ncbi:MAG TPA: ABC transporter ATP-binding protein [Polyangiales bacterium]|nr:ABC transporter ATP-binding protein [Polyangiales bacterium]
MAGAVPQSAARAPLPAADQAPRDELGEPSLALRGLRHAFGGRRVLDGVSLEVLPGELFGLLGPNGCGKSTTLRVLTGGLIPDAGEIWWRGQRVAPGDRALRSSLGVVFQSPSLDQRLSARENLMLAARLQGYRGREAETRVTRALEFADLQPRAAEKVAALSGGMKRRLELSRALLHDPALLLLDEPTTGLDEASFQRAWQHIAQLRARNNASVIVATHRAEEAAQCDRVAVLDQGRLVACDTPQALIDRVSGDVLALDVADPKVAAEEIRRRFGLEARLLDGKLLLERERGHELVPRLVEALPAGSIRSLSMHRPSLADVFVKLTGRSLGEENV